MIMRALIAAATLAGGLFAGRRVLNAKIAHKIPVEIETARRTALAELDKRADAIIGETLLALLLSLVIKAGLIGAAYWLYAEGHLTATGMKIVGIAMIAAFIIRDLANILPYAAPAWRILLSHEFHLKTALQELVAGVAFERAYAEAIRATESGPTGALLAFSKYSAQSISEDIAAAVAAIARTATFDLVKTRAIIASLAAVAMFGAYWAFFHLTVFSV